MRREGGARWPYLADVADTGLAGVAGVAGVAEVAALPAVAAVPPAAPWARAAKGMKEAATRAAARKRVARMEVILSRSRPEDRPAGREKWPSPFGRINVAPPRGQTRVEL